MGHSLSILFAFVLTACGTATSVKMEILPQDNVTFRFIDSRPESERLSQRESSSEGVTAIFGDTDLTPSPPALVKGYFAKHLPELLTNRTVTLTGFRVKATDPTVSLDRNRFETSVQSVPNASPGGVLLAAPLILGIESIKSEKTITVVIRGKVDDMDFISYFSEKVRGRATENDIQGVIVTGLEGAVADLRRTLTK